MLCIFNPDPENPDDPENPVDFEETDDLENLADLSGDLESEPLILRSGSYWPSGL